MYLEAHIGFHIRLYSAPNYMRCWHNMPMQVVLDLYGGKKRSTALKQHHPCLSAHCYRVVSTGPVEWGLERFYRSQ